MKKTYCTSKKMFPLVVLTALMCWQSLLIAEESESAINVNTAITFDSTRARPTLIFPGSLRQHVNMADTIAQDSVRKITADRAKIISPAVRSVFTGEPIVYEIEPTVAACSVILFVRHSQTLIDTLGTFTSPPYRAVWDNAALTNQDQIHLQFGYTLFVGDTLIITSPPLPHRWTLKRPAHVHTKKTQKKHSAKQVAFISFDVNGDLKKWENIPWVEIDSVARFKTLWTEARLHFIIEVQDTSVTPGDFVELHIDMYNDREIFFSINHRNLRFSPLAGSRSFAVELTDDSFKYADSVNALFNDEAERHVVIDSASYIIETAIPFAVLSNLVKVPQQIGFGVSVMNVDWNDDGTGPGGTVSFYSWTHAPRYFRYSPSSLGTLQLKRISFALQSVFVFVIFLTCAVFLLFIGNSIISELKTKKRDPIDDDNYSPLTNEIIEFIENELANQNFNIADVQKHTGKSAVEIEETIKKDLDISFEQFLKFKRVKHSQKLLNNADMSIDEIAKQCGFANANDFNAAFTAQMRVSPEVSRQARIAAILEDERARLEEENDDE